MELTRTNPGLGVRANSMFALLPVTHAIVLGQGIRFPLRHRLSNKQNPGRFRPGFCGVTSQAELTRRRP